MNAMLRMAMEKLREYMPPKEVTRVVYHAPCADGSAAGCTAMRALREQGSLRTIPFDYNVGLTPDAIEIIRGENVLFLDASIARSVYDQARAVAKKVAVIDHHVTSVENLKGLEGVLIDTEFCGSVLAWMFFFGDEPLPLSLSYVQEKDLYKWSSRTSRAKWFANYTYEAMSLGLEHFYEILFDQATFERSVEEGRRMALKVSSYALLKASQAVPRTFEGVDVMLVESDVHSTEIGHTMTHAYDVVAAVYSLNPKVSGGKRYKVSLRSEPDLPTVNDLAKRHGGGGHPQASGFNCDDIDALFLKR